MKDYWNYTFGTKEDDDKDKVIDYWNYTFPEKKPSQVAAEEQKEELPIEQKKVGIWEKVKNKVKDIDQTLTSKLPEKVKEKGLFGALLKDKEEEEYTPPTDKQESEAEEIDKLSPPKPDRYTDNQFAAITGSAKQELVEGLAKEDELRYKISIAEREASTKLGFAFTGRGVLDDVEVMKLRDELVYMRKNNDSIRKFLGEGDAVTAGTLANSLASSFLHTVIEDVAYASQSGQMITTTMNPFRSLLESEEMARYHMIESKFNSGDKLSDEETALYNSKMTESKISLIRDATLNDIAEGIGSGIYGTIEYMAMIAASGTGVTATTPIVKVAVKKGLVDGLVKAGISASKQALTIFSPRIAADLQNYLLPDAVQNEEGIQTWDDLIEYEESDETVFSAAAKSISKNWMSFFIENALSPIIEAAGVSTGLNKAGITKFLAKNGNKTNGDEKAIYKMLSTLLDSPEDLLGKGVVWKVVNRMLSEGKPLSEISKAIGKTGFDSLPQEVLEEEVTALSDALIDGEKYQAPFFTKEGTERFLIEVLTILPFSGISAVSDIQTDKRLSFLEDNPNIESYGTEEQIQEIDAVVEELNDDLNVEVKIPEPAGVVEKEEEGLGMTNEDFDRLKNKETLTVIPKTTPSSVPKVFTEALKDSPTLELYVESLDEVTDENSQVGFIDASKVTPRDVDKIDLEKVESIKEAILSGEEMPPSIISDVGDTLETTDGTHRATAYQDLKKPMPVVYNGKNAIEGLTKVSDLYESLSKEVKPKKITKTAQKKMEKAKNDIIDPNEKPITKADTDSGGDDRSGQPTDTVRDGTKEQVKPSETADVNSESVARRISEVSDTGTGIGLAGSIKELKSQLKDYEERKALFAVDDGLGIDNTSKYDRLIKETKETIAELEQTYENPMVSIEESIVQLPEDLQLPARKDWLNQYSDEYQKTTTIKEQDALVEAFIEKWKSRGLKETKPSVPVTKTAQADINSEIEALVKMKTFNYKYTKAELELIKQYTGSGGMESAGAEGRGLLDEYYTPKPIVDFMWDKVADSFYQKVKGQDATFGMIGLGLSILEPAAGIGGFFDTKSVNGVKTAYEINEVSAKIIKALYPTARVLNESFEGNFMGMRGEKIFPKQEYNIVVGNPPYGEHRGKYLGLGEEQKIKKYEDYFIKRGLDVLVDNGLLAYVVPSSFLRSSADYAKSEISKLGFLEDAYRLPNGVFGTTSIGTDIIFIRKHELPKGSTDASIYKVTEKLRATSLSSNNWFLDNPDKVLGEVSLGTGNYGADEVKGTLQEAIAKVAKQPVEVQETIPTEEAVENQKAIVEEIKESQEEAKVDKMPNKPKSNVPRAVVDKVNQKAIIIPNKKYGTMTLSNAPKEQETLWKAVQVTGELNSSFTSAFTPETFRDKNIALSFEDGVAKYYPNVLYYQGNIYEKLNDLELNKSKMSVEQYNTQKKGLKDVLPTPKTVDEIQFQPPSDFVHSLRITQDGEQVRLVDLFHTYLRALPYEAFGGSTSWEISGYVDGSPVRGRDKLYNMEIRKRRREIGNAMFGRFITETLTPEQKAIVADRYNKALNAYHKPDYKDVPLLAKINDTFNPNNKSGKHPLVVRGVQKEGASFLATKGVGLLGYDVGVGKTLTSIIAINEVMKKGWAKKPLVVVTNSTYLKWINEISEVMPDVKINSLSNLGGAFKGDLKTLQIEDGTLSIMTYEGLNKLGFSKETYDELTVGLKDVMQGENNTKRAKAKQDEQIEQQIGKAIKGTRGDRFFNDLGFDHITIDEVQNFKNIFAGAKMERGKGNEYRNVRGSSSARGIKAYLMAQYVLNNNNNRNVFLLSATPFSNSPLEIYSILSLMGKKRLEEIGLKNVNDFMSMFMELKPTFVVKANQQVAEEDVIEKFQNLQELQKIVTEFIDFRTGEEAGVERPSKIKRTIDLHPTELQNQYFEEAQKLFQDKDAGGAIVAITELQNITLSPYLSRYNNVVPTYKEFVENSPKIKYAIEAIAQVRKDNKDVGQVLYMPRGTKYIPLVVEYLTKEKGLKPSQVGVMQGGMSVNKKQAIQAKFNKGTIKVLIGTETIKEGVDLQENSTDMYHLHLPWNPTDMQQVEGRIWRQGNNYANVRIHYPLVENSVDSFIFQKLETKEKRIRNLWSYKDNEINVGDLDFENMKLDLITDPVVRVKAEETFETKKEKTKLQKLETEKAFADRKIDKLAKAIKEVKEAKDMLEYAQKEVAENPDSYFASGIERYIKRISTAQAEVTKQRNDLIKKGLNVKDLEGKSASMGEAILEQDKVVSAIRETYAIKIEEAKKKQQGKPKVIPNNYFVLTREIANENASFFKKRKGQDKVRASNTTYKTPSGEADIGGYSDIESATKTVGNLKAMEFPEMLAIEKALSGKTPFMKKYRRALGKSYADGGIGLSPEIWETPGLPAKVFAHEVGHLSDRLPDYNIKRGNIIGRIHTLNKFLKGTFGDSEVTNIEIRSELKDLSQKWKPFDELQNPNFTSYRYSSKELYADALSVLFNDPALLQAEAPLFWKEFFANLDKKPAVLKEFNDTWNLLNEGEDAVFKRRNEEIDKNYGTGEETWAAKEVEKQQRKIHIWSDLRTLFDDKNHKLNQKVKGKNLPDAINPAFAYESLKYLDGKIKNYVENAWQPVFIKAQEVPNGWKELGKILQMERVINERGEMANPLGYDPKTAQDFLTKLEGEHTPEEWKILQESLEMFRNTAQADVRNIEKNGFATPELVETMKANKAYATFQTLDYVDDYMSASIGHQIGTLKSVANPATATVMKSIAIRKAIEKNNARKMGVDFQRDFYKDEIEDAKTTFSDGRQVIIRSTDPEQGTVTVVRNGKPIGYYVPKDYANIMNNVSSDMIMSGAKISRMLTGSKHYRTIFTTINLGFQLNNLQRDFWRYWKAMPDRNLGEALLSLPRAVKRYGQAVPHAWKEVRGLTDELTKEMESKKILGLSFNDMFQNPNESDRQQIERIMDKAGVTVTAKKKGIRAVGEKIVDSLALFGNLIERLPKLAGYIELKGRMPEQELAHFIRNYVGSPDFRKGGSLTPISNNIFLFSNAYKEGFKSDAKLATGKSSRTYGKQSRSGFWWKTIMRDILPKVLQWGGAAGLLGACIKKVFDDATEYDKTNYTIIPVSCDDGHGNSIYIRLPSDETGRFISGLFWKMTQLMSEDDKLDMKDAMEVFSFGAGQVPNLVPSIKGAEHLVTYFSGQNPYDSYRGRNVLTDDQFNAGFGTSFPIFMDWLLKQQGLGIVLPSYKPEGDVSNLEKWVNAPVLSNILGRYVKVTNYGRKEQLDEVKQNVVKEEAKARQEEKDKLKKYVKEYYKGSQSLTSKMEIRREFRLDVLGEPPWNKTKAKALDKKFNIAVVKGINDPEVTEVIYASSNAQKVALLVNIKNNHTEEEYRALKIMLFQEKIASKEVLKEVDSK